jgi:hypothetical protein
MNLPPNYYHCFLGNGLDAVLIGPTGSMVADKVAVDRCVWYKSDRYYPEEKLVMVAGRWPEGVPLEHAEGSGWFELAPLGRTWYTISLSGQQLALQASEQRFVPQDGTLYTQLDYGAVKGEAETWMHVSKSILAERYMFDQEVEFTAWMAPGVWLNDGWDTDPFHSVHLSMDAAHGRYDLGETCGIMGLRLEGDGAELIIEGQNRGLRVRARSVTKYFMILDNRQGSLDEAQFDQLIARGYDALRDEHLRAWRTYFTISRIDIPDEQFQYFYEASMYHLRAMQNPVSGGLPVNNLRRTWSSHIFWDAFFLQRALLEANHRHEALESARFFQRTLESARRHAREEFGCEGLKWDWEITHDGRKAYGALLHQKFQIHNNASHANQIWGYYEYTQDQEFLAEFFPILEGLARFYLDCVVRESDGRVEIGYFVGVHEKPEQVRNDGINVAGTIVILEHYAHAARLLGRENSLSQLCEAAALGLRETANRLFNGHYFQAAEDLSDLNMSSIAPIYPMKVFDAADPRAVATAQAFIDKYDGRIVGHGGSESGFPWAAGVLGTILAMQGNAEAAWRIIETTRPTICIHGGMTEVMDENGWNMQYFGTAQGAVCTALHNLLLQTSGTEIRLFPALPWETAAFENLLAAGFEVSAKHDHGSVTCALVNAARVPLVRTIVYKGQQREVTLNPGEQRQLSWSG